MSLYVFGIVAVTIVGLFVSRWSKVLRKKIASLLQTLYTKQKVRKTIRIAVDDKALVAVK